MLQKITKKIILGVILIGSFSVSFSYAARITIDAPEMTLSNRQPVVITLKLDNEGKSLSGVSGNFSFPNDLFTVDSFITESSIVSPWIIQPKISEEKYLDNRTHIVFEGIFPGGYRGVQSPYYQGVEPGALFSIVLIPKQKGNGLLVVDDIVLNEYSPDALPLSTVTVSKSITVPDAQGQSISPYKDTKQLIRKTLIVEVLRDPLVIKNAWYLLVNDREPVSSIEYIYIAETDDKDALLVRDMNWRAVASPYVLSYQNRTKYIHVKVMYSNKTYVVRTLPPVENSQSIPLASRILLSIAVLSALLYLHDKKFYSYLRKKIQ